MKPFYDDPKFFLFDQSMGSEQAPHNNAFKEMTPASRKFWLERLSQLYRKQREVTDCIKVDNSYGLEETH